MEKCCTIIYYARPLFITLEMEKQMTSIINGQPDFDRLDTPIYAWAVQKFKDGCSNHWLAQEIPMAKDIATWKTPNALTPDERTIIKRNLGFFSTADSLVANNLILGISKHITNPECRQYLQRQAYEEAIHTEAYQYCIESLGMDEGEIFNMYREIPSVARKSAWVLKHTKVISDPNFKLDSLENRKAFLANLIAFYCVMEGLFFYCGFTQILSMGRRNIMTAVSEQFQMILRDECITGDTEVLTRTGWKRIDQVVATDSLMQWDQTSGLTWSPIRDLTTHTVNQLYELTGPGITQICSPNHRIAFLNKDQQLNVSYAKNLINYDLNDLSFMTYPINEDYQRMIKVSGGLCKLQLVEPCIPTTVFGVEVDSGFILIRKDNKVSVTGNSIHANFGIDLINQIKLEQPELWDHQMQQHALQMLLEGTLLEIDYAHDTMPNGIIGFNAQTMSDYLKFICNRRLEQLGLTPYWQNTSNPFPWMSEMMDLRKEKNFFETRVTDYQVSSLDWG